MGAIGVRGWSGRICEISLFVTFLFCFFLFFRFFTSPAGRHGWPILTIYTSKCAVPRKEVPFGSLDDNPKCLRGEIPPPKKTFLGPNRHFKPNFRKLKLQYLRKYKSDRHKILNIASGHQVDFVGGPKIKSNQIQDGGGRHFEQEAQLPLRNRASATYFFVAKLISIAHSCL